MAKRVEVALTDNEHGIMVVTLADTSGPFNNWSSENEGGRLGVNSGMWINPLSPHVKVELRDQSNRLVATLLDFVFTAAAVGTSGSGTKNWEHGTFNDDTGGLRWEVSSVL